LRLAKAVKAFTNLYLYFTKKLHPDMRPSVGLDKRVRWLSLAPVYVYGTVFAATLSTLNTGVRRLARSEELTID